MKFTNNDGLSLEVMLNQQHDHLLMISGGNPRSPTWEEYLQDFRPEFREYFKLIRTAIEFYGWVGKTGEKIANNYTFVFSNDVNIGFTWRAWGDLMQAIIGKREGYMKYYV